MVISETCTKSNDKNDIIGGYQTFHCTGGHTLRIGCGCMVKDGLKCKQQTNLKMSSKDENKELQSCWIEIINNSTSNIITACYYSHPLKSQMECL